MSLYQSNIVDSPLELTAEQTEYIHGQCLTNLLSARVVDEGWFMAAPGYGPYGNYVWLRDNAECVMALDEYSATFGKRTIFEYTGKALLRSFRYLESKEKGVGILSAMRSKVANPDFYNAAYHPHARLSSSGEELTAPWNNIQYDSVARTIIALAKHLSFTRDTSFFQKCERGLKVAMNYLFDAIWDNSGTERMLTVSANEWEEIDEAHLRRPLFSSVVGLIYAASRYAASLQEYVEMRNIELKEYETQTRSMIEKFFLYDGVIRMIKRFQEPALGICSSSLWLMTTYGVFPSGSDTFSKTIESLAWNENLTVELGLKDIPQEKACGLRRYEIASWGEPYSNAYFVDEYWGGQAWIITTAELAIALAMKGDAEHSRSLLQLCIQARNSEGKLPEQFEGTYLNKEKYEKWKLLTRAQAPPQWLAWSHAEVLKAYTAMSIMN